MSSATTSASTTNSSTNKWIQARRERAFRLLAAREQSQQELQEKLLKPTAQEIANPDLIPGIEVQEQLVQDLMQWLQEQDLQSDARFIASLTNKLLRQGKGIYAFKQAWSQHQLAPNLIAAQLAQLEDLWEQQVIRVKEKRFGTQPPVDARDAAKMQRFLAQKGFTAAQIYLALAKR